MEGVFLLKKFPRFHTWLPVGANVHRWFWLEYRWFWSRWEASVPAPNVGLRRSTPRKCTLVGNYGHSDWTKSPEKQRVITDGLEWEKKDRGDHQMVLLQGTLWTQKSSMRWSLLHSKESTLFSLFFHTGAKILNSSKNSHCKISFIWQNSHFQSLFFRRIHILNISFFTKFTFFKHQILSTLWIKSWFLPQCECGSVPMQLSTCISFEIHDFTWNV